MASTIKLQDAAQSSVSNLLSSLTTNTARENAQAEKLAKPATPAKPSAPAEEKTGKEEIKTVTTPKSEKKEAADLDLTKVGVCFNVPKYIKDMWKTYFTTHGLTMTDGLIQAVNYLKEQEEKGEVKLGAISILKN